MPMQKRVWSLNALAVELGMDRRTLAKRLQGLPPAESKQVGNRLEKRWYLADVLAHIDNPPASSDEDRFIQDIKHMIGHKLFPSIIASKAFGAIIVNGCCDELGLDKAQGLRIYQYTTIALVYALCELHEDDDMTFAIPDHMKELAELGPEAYMEKVAAD